jgi:hypothetical protein
MNILKRKWFSVDDAVSSAARSDATMDSDQAAVTAIPVNVPTGPVVPQRSNQRKDPLDKIVNIIVGNGNDTKPFPNHRRILNKESKHFRDSFKQNWDTTSFSLPNEDPDIYARVAHWMYFKRFIYDEEMTQDDETEGDSSQASVNIDDEPSSPAALVHGRVDLQNDIFHGTASLKHTIEVVDLDEGSDGSGDDEPAQALRGSQARTDAPTPLDTLTLSKVWALAKLLGVPKLCDEIIDLLGKRLGYDMKTPGDALIYAFQRCRPDSPLRRLLVDFTARSAPITDLLEAPNFDATDFAPELWCALVGGLTMVRGNQYLNQAEWAQNFEHTVSEYYINNSRVPFRPKVTA